MSATIEKHRRNNQWRAVEGSTIIGAWNNMQTARRTAAAWNAYEIPNINGRLLEALKKAADAIESDYAHSIGFLDGTFPTGEPITIDWLEWAKHARAAIAEAETNATDELDELRNKAWRLREIENFLECEDLMDRFEDWYLDKQHELAAKHDPTL